MSCVDQPAAVKYDLSPATLDRIRALRDAVQTGLPTTSCLNTPIYREVFEQIKNDSNVD